MIKIENTITPSGCQWLSIIMGMRNPMNSWDRSDSRQCGSGDCDICIDYDECPYNHNPYKLIIGNNDLALMEKLSEAGPVHGKFRRMITVYADITAPLYWWKEFDTYKVGTVANSCSTMHKIHEKEFTLEDFSHEHLMESVIGFDLYPPKQELYNTIFTLNKCREMFLKTRDKEWWWQMIQLLPSSYNQKRTVMMNYEVLANIYEYRKNHKLDEWSVGFIDWIKSLPYSGIITGEWEEESKNDQV